MFAANKTELRGFFVSAWEAHQQGQTLTPLQTLVTSIIAQHPEYHPHLDSDTASARDFKEGETNPFLHMGMHITLAEQLSTDRPPGIRQLHQQITRQNGDAHKAEHQMMDCLGLVLWEAQRQNRTPDEVSYLACLRKLLLK